MCMLGAPVLAGVVMTMLSYMHHGTCIMHADRCIPALLPAGTYCGRLGDACNSHPKHARACLCAVQVERFASEEAAADRGFVRLANAELEE